VADRQKDIFTLKVNETVRDWVDDFKYLSKKEQRQKLTTNEVVELLIKNYDETLRKAAETGGVDNNAGLLNNEASHEFSSTPALRVLLARYGPPAVDRLARAVLQLGVPNVDARRPPGKDVFDLPYPDPFEEANQEGGRTEVADESGRDRGDEN
jgi:hypothetical protein